MVARFSLVTVTVVPGSARYSSAFINDAWRVGCALKTRSLTRMLGVSSKTPGRYTDPVIWTTGWGWISHT
jgi:hypothetical protein